MAAANAVLSRGTRRRGHSIDILAVAPLPFRRNGAVTFLHGVAIFYAELLPRLAAAGHRVRVFVEAPAARRGEHRQQLGVRPANLTVDGFAFPYRSGSRPPTRAYEAALDRDLRPRFARALRRRRPDVVLVGREILAPYVAALCRAHRLPYVVVAHGVALAAMRSPAYSERQRRRLAAGLRGAARVVAVAAHLQRELRELGVTRVETIANVVDPRRFRPRVKDPRLLARLGIGRRDPVVGHFSMLSAVKRPIDVVASAERVLQAVPQCWYLVAGDGPCRADMERAAEQLGISARFRFVGELAHSAVARYMNACDLVVMPSERESLPLVYGEAQASGCPMVVSDIPAAREAVAPNRSGVLFAAGDIAALAAATVRLLRDPRLRRTLGANARAVVAHQSPRRWSTAYVEVLTRAIAEHGSEHGPRWARAPHERTHAPRVVAIEAD